MKENLEEAFRSEIWTAMNKSISVYKELFR